MDIAFINPRQMTNRDWLGDIQTFSDIVKLPLSDIMDYYHMNTEQRTSLRWLVDNHISMLAERYIFEPDGVRSVLSVTRCGVNKETQFIILSLILIRFERLRADVLDNRLVLLGLNGGKNLVNPARRGNDVHGKYVLIKPALHSKLEPRTFS